MQAAAKKGYDAYIQKVLDLMENGKAPWHKPWAAGVPPQNLLTRRQYSGYNAFYLGMVAQERGCPYFLTFRQAKSAGGFVKAGAKGLPIVFWQPSTYKAKDEASGEDVEKRSLLSKVHYVFNALDVEGVPVPTEAQGMPKSESPNHVAERLLLGVKPVPRIQWGGDRACYVPVLDEIRMPEMLRFESMDRYWATLFHELTHWTGHQSRLNRSSLKDVKAFGDYEYSREELVAEMGAGLVCSTIGIENSVVEQSAAYLRSWMKGLREDPMALVWAAGRAQEAANFILKDWKQPGQAPAGVAEEEGVAA